jgi:hypothetical protein
MTYVEPIFENHKIKLWNLDCSVLLEEMSKCDAVILDPPFDSWSKVPFFKNKTKVCFTNFQNRDHVTKLYGKPRFELIWHFKDGRWTSHNLPRTTHESILIYGPTGEAYVGKHNENMKPQKKGKGSIGRNKMTERTYVPRRRKALNSVLEYSRNVRGQMGCWGKPVKLLSDIIAWLDVRTIADPFAGSCSVATAARDMDVKILASEIDLQTCHDAIDRLNELSLP